MFALYMQNVLWGKPKTAHHPKHPVQQYNILVAASCRDREKLVKIDVKMNKAITYLWHTFQISFSQNN